MLGLQWENMEGPIAFLMIVPLNLRWAESYLEHIDYVVEVNKGVINGESIHCVRIKWSSSDPGAQCGQIGFLWPPLLCLRNATGSVEGNAAISQSGNCREPALLEFYREA